MDPKHALTIHFMDGSKVSYAFPQQADNVAARQLRVEEFLKSSYLMLMSDGVLTVLPVANIKAIQLAVGEAMKDVPLPKHVVRGATLARGEL